LQRSEYAVFILNQMPEREGKTGGGCCLERKQKKRGAHVPIIALLNYSPYIRASEGKKKGKEMAVDSVAQEKKPSFPLSPRGIRGTGVTILNPSFSSKWKEKKRGADPDCLREAANASADREVLPGGKRRVVLNASKGRGTLLSIDLFLVEKS